ncbi:NAD(P)/FAD-dependent oxidoreductase [Nitrospirillum sp. BR 11828]|uniref:flavin monoamine oxidase family protein n=1 Tax=Nitrospirillum sp. BR 11828 TaxID=3104325 RepID=UPI002ACAC7A0|nr:NAD(P)/FAD-dependent oxidoreductase [Nitrospirillum sp. BR 11828]MDZ5649740.1 NAD(P)/FAD-dependent oxidoreductase [Nitrospirillum sp. BR 11828]
MLTRRVFVAGTAALAALPKRVNAAKGPAAEAADVIILGAGLSGLYAALTLRDNGLRVLVLDAADQPGGRVKTVHTADGPIDVGASQVGRSYARVIDACRAFGLKLVPEDRDLLPFGAHYMDSWIDPKTWASNPLNECVGDERAIPPMLMGQAVAAKYNPLKALDDWLDPKFGDFDISLRQLMRAKGYSEQAIRLAALSAPGIGIDETSLLRMWQEDTRQALDKAFAGSAPAEGHRDHPFGEGNSRQMVNGLAQISNIEGGCQRLPLAMADKLGDVVRLKKKVARVEMTDSAATVTCADGSRYQARFVISALPFSMLRDVVIDAAPNPVMRDAIGHMPYANTARLYLTVERPFWQADGLPASFSTDGPMGMFWAIDNHTGTGPHRAMIVMVGNVAQKVSRMDAVTAQAFLVAEVERLRPAAKGLLKIATYKDWLADPLQRGCGFSLAPGQVNAFARKMVDPWQVMHFAGEHTRRMDFGMESALESGERAAVEVLARA